jgi:hypothetical protein
MGDHPDARPDDSARDPPRARGLTQEKDMSRLAHYATPHLWGTIDYVKPGRLQPDGDTIHLRNPCLVMMGKLIKPEAGKLEVTMPGKARPYVLELRGDPPHYLPIRLSGLDAPERHYVASVRPDPTIPAYEPREGRHRTVCQPHHEPALEYIMRVAARWPKMLVELDREVIDKRERVLGFLCKPRARPQGPRVPLRLRVSR